MRYLIIISLFLIVKLPAFSQGAFHLKHTVPYDNEVFDIAECEKGYLLVGNSSPTTPVSNGYLLFLNHNGDIVWEKIIPAYLPDNYEQYRSVVYHDGYFYIGGFSDMNDDRFSILTKIDMQGNISYKKKIGSENIYAYDNLLNNLLVNGEGILVATSGFNGTGTAGELVQVDFEGNILWNNKFFNYIHTSNSYWEYFEDMKKGKDGNFILTLLSNANNLDFPCKSLIKVNPDGEEIWRKTFDTLKPSALTEDSMLYFMTAAPFKENHVLAYFAVDTFPKVDYRTDIALIEYDEYGNEINYKRFYNSNGFGNTNIYTNKDNEIFISGTRHYEDSLRLTIIKFSADKEIEWIKSHYKEPDSTIVNALWINVGEFFKCGIPTSDNGFLMTGGNLYMIANDHYWNSTIIKTDCEGNTTWDYSRCSSPEFEDITIFPNPSSDNFIIQLPDLQEKDKIQIAVYDVMGKLVQLSEHSAKGVITLNSSIWAEGTYICRITVNNEVVKTEKLLKIDGM